MNWTREIVRLVAIVANLAIAGPALAGSSWQLRSVPSGSGRWIANRSMTFVVLGDFEGGSIARSTNGGFDWSIRSPGLQVPADSIVALTYSGSRYVALGRRGELWLSRSGSDFQPAASPADSFGIASALHDAGDEIWVGTSQGWLLRSLDIDQGWTPVERLGPPGVREIASLGFARAAALLEDGRLLAQDTTFVEAPLRAEAISFPRSGQTADRGQALERSTHHLWETTNGGIDWSLKSTALGAPEFAPWAERARAFVHQPDLELSLIPCGDVLLVSEDGGIGWRIAASGTGMFLDAAVDEIGEIVTVGARIHRSTDHAFSLVQTIGGDFGRIEIGSSRTLWALDRGLLLSIDRGDRWLRQPLPVDPLELRLLEARGEYEIWIHFDGPQGSRTYYSDDRGIRYEPLDPGGMLSGAKGWSFADSGFAWAYNDSTVLRSTDEGRSWEIVLDRMSGIDALASRDSLQAAVSTGERIVLTRDGGATWIEGDLPPGSAPRALGFAADDRLVVVGGAVLLLAGDPPWDDPIRHDFGDTLEDVALTDSGIGWAVGRAGLLIETRDGGATWSRYRVDLEINALRSDLTQIDALDASHAVTGTAGKILRLLPDGSGPSFRFGVSINPHLRHYLDIHITAHERLLGDTLHVEIDGEPIPATLLDPDGYLYRVRYRIPSLPGEGQIVTRGSDWTGNARTDSRILMTVVLDRAGRGSSIWSGVPLRIEGPAVGSLAFLEEPEVLEEGSLPPGWEAIGSPLRIALAGPTAIGSTTGAARLARWREGRWEILAAGEVTGGNEEIFSLLRPIPIPGDLPHSEDLLKVFPIPTRGDLSIDWTGPRVTLARWEIFDLSGRRLTGGEMPQTPGGPWRLHAVDGSGRPLAAGIYWLRVREGSDEAVRRLVIAR